MRNKDDIEKLLEQIESSDLQHARSGSLVPKPTPDLIKTLETLEALKKKTKKRTK